MDRFKYFHKIMTLPQKKWMPAIDVVKEQTSFNRYIPETEDIKISNYDISLLQFLFCKNTVNLQKCVAAIALL